jgi:putative MATE family efflux protein
MVLEMLMEAIFGVVDMLFVGRLGSEAVAAVGITESLLTLVFAVAIGLSVAASALIARLAGAGRCREMGVVAVQAIGLGVVCSLVTGVVGVLWAEDILRFMGTSSTGVELGTPYAQALFGGSVTIYMLFLINAIFRGAGAAVVALKALWLANLVNLLLDPLLIFGWGPFPEMGLLGAAVATNIGRGVGMLYQVWALWGGVSGIVINRQSLRHERMLISQITSLSAAAMVQSLISTASWLGLVRVMAFFGPAAVAGYTIALRILIFAILPAWGLCNATATLVGQNLGARRPQRAEHAVWATGFVNLMFLSLVGLVFVIFAEPLIQLFSKDPEVISQGSSALRMISYGFVFYAYGLVLTQAFNGAGDTLTPTWISFATYWVFQIPLAYCLALPLGFGATGVFAAIPISETFRAVVCVVLFRRGKWKRRLG